MNLEAEIVQTSMGIFRKIRQQAPNALTEYLKILPESTLQGMAQHLVRQYFKEQPGRKANLSEENRALIAAAVCQQVLNDCVKRARQRKTSANDKDLDGAELFYRRALNHISAERFTDAERLLKRAVEICPDFADGWDLLVEVYEENGKSELAEIAREKLEKLNKLKE